MSTATPRFRLSDGRTVEAPIPQGQEVRAGFRRAIVAARSRAEQYREIARALAGFATDLRDADPDDRRICHPLGEPDDRSRSLIATDLASLWDVGRRLEKDAVALLAHAGVLQLQADGLEADRDQLTEAGAFDDSDTLPPVSPGRGYVDA